MIFMKDYSINDIILIKYPFTDLTKFKVRPAIIVNIFIDSDDLILVPLTSKIHNLKHGEFILENSYKSGLNIASAVKRGIITIDSKLILKKVGYLYKQDIKNLQKSIKLWLNIKE